MNGLTMGTLLQCHELIITILLIVVTHCVAKLIKFKLIWQVGYCNKTDASSSYCRNVYGCELWNLSNYYVGYFCVTWSTGVTIVWGLPRTLSVLLATLFGSILFLTSCIAGVVNSFIPD